VAGRTCKVVRLDMGANDLKQNLKRIRIVSAKPLGLVRGPVDDHFAVTLKAC
jgi:hypothetical protein